MARTRIILAAQSPISRALIGRLLARLPWVEQVGEATNLAEALDLISATRPDLAVLGSSLVASREFDTLRAAMQSASCRWIEISARQTAGEGGAALRDGRGLPVLTHGLAVEEAGPAVKSVLAAPLPTAPVPVLQTPPPPPSAPAAPQAATDRFLLFGASTGGVDALLEIL